MNSRTTETVLAALKDFQRDTVDYAFRRMYEDAQPATRFLIADEVGLGKTKVAAGIVARAVDFIRAADPERRIDIIYICSNASIARQNIDRLNVTRHPCKDMPDRITLLPREMSKLKQNSVNFIAFTPGTSLNLRSSGGKASERALLFWLLPKAWKANEKGVVSLLTGSMMRHRFQERVDDHKRFTIDEDLAQAFRQRIEVVPEGVAAGESLRERFLRLADLLGGRSPNARLTDEELRERGRLVGELRSILAAVCVDSLEPDLVILDEFQRFSNVLRGEDDASRLARQLFQYRDGRSVIGDVRVLLLSATPYRMFTTADESDDGGHYEDLIRTIGFLQNDAAKTEVFGQALSAYGRELFRVGEDDGEALTRVRATVTKMLREVMVRTERLAVTADRSGMLVERSPSGMGLTDKDVQAYLSLQDLARALESSDATEYWKSAPYLVNFMDDYEMKRDFEDAAKGKGLPKEAIKALSEGVGSLLARTDISSYCQIDPGNARLRSLMHDMVESDAWRLLWIPSSRSYYRPDGEFAAPSVKGLTKRLIFSSWQVVPKVVAALTTYEVERRMTGVADGGSAGSNESAARVKRGGRLKFSAYERLTPVLGLLYPSVSLAVEADPCVLQDRSADGAMPTLGEVLGKAREICARLLADLDGGTGDGTEDESWYWAAPILIDAQRHPDITKNWFAQATLADAWRGELGNEGEGSEEPRALQPDEADVEGAWEAHVRAARVLLADGGKSLGRQPSNLADVLALLALGGPAVTAMRSLARVSGGLQRLTDTNLRNCAGRVADGFRSLFNQPDVTVMIQNRADKEPYWERVLEYCCRGGLQAVLDEFAHVLAEHLGVADKSPDVIVKAVATYMRKSLTLRAANVSADAVDVDHSAQTVHFADNDIRFRTRFAVRYGARDLEESGAILRASDVQKAFNSPFWPFVLCSTSVGQEGLDFHLYCHAVMHWNLPSNPVDFEQREGRIHRYKGHAVRKNVAKDFAHGVEHHREGPESDAWRQIFAAARLARPANQSDLVPFWVYVTEGGAHIERHLPMIPLSKDVARAEVLRRSLAIYRMAFGQSRQDDLIAFLQERLKTPEQIEIAKEQFRIDLTPDESPHRGRSGQAPRPGDLSIDAAEEGAVASIDLAAFESLLDGFSAIRPKPRILSVDLVRQLLDEFAALQRSE